MVKHPVTETTVKVSKAHLVPVKYLDGECSTLGALGWGQIQIANSRNISIHPKQTRRTSMLRLCDNVLEFYRREIGKITGRLEKLESVSSLWLKTAG